MARVHLSAVDPHADGPLQAKLDEHDTALDAIEATPGGVDFSGLTEGAIAKAVGGVPADAVNQIDYIGPQATASVASATTITLPETGLLVPITGNTVIDFITKPTGNAPRLALLWFGSGLHMRHEVAGAGAGAAHISLVVGNAAGAFVQFQANTLVMLVFDGTIWRRASDGAHWDAINLRITGAAGENAALTLNSSTGSRLEYGGAANSVVCNGDDVIHTAKATRFTSRTRFTQGAVASASNVTLPTGCSSILVTGTTTINTFTSTGWEEGMEVSLEFADVLTITDNSGGANDFVAKTAGNITTAAGMVLKFRFDGTDLREIGR